MKPVARLTSSPQLGGTTRQLHEQAKIGVTMSITAGGKNQHTFYLP